jgi:hypothetical protein
LNTSIYYNFNEHIVCEGKEDPRKCIRPERKEIEREQEERVRGGSKIGFAFVFDIYLVVVTLSISWMLALDWRKN